MRSTIAVLFFAFFVCTNAIPKHGNFGEKRVAIDGGVVNVLNHKFSCVGLTMISDSPIRVSLRRVESKSPVDIIVETRLYESECESVDKKDCSSQSREVAYNRQKLSDLSNGPQDVKFMMSSTMVLVPNNNGKPGTATSDTPPNESEGGTDPGNIAENKANTVSTQNITKNKRDTESAGNTAVNTESTENTADGVPLGKPNSNWHTFLTEDSGVYLIRIFVNNTKAVGVFYSLTFKVEMRNHYGYLSLVDYPALIVYSLLMVVYVFYAFLWLILMARNSKDIIRLQFWILAVILLGFLEKIFFVAEYGSANEGNDSSGLIYIAEGVSAAKRALARVLLIIVCEGFGTVKPRLGSTLTKVIVVGGIYFIVAFIDGVARASKATTDGYDLITVVAFVLLFLIDVGILYWISSALVKTRRTLRIHKNATKLAMYKYLAYALLAIVIASVAFIIWQFVALTREGCTTDWREMWLMDCFWHMLFCFILLVIMVIWRPSANKLRFAYSQVNSEDSEEEEQGANKNFESVKMRTVSKPDGPKSLMSQEAEDDKAEENLTTTLIGEYTTFPVIFDSEEVKLISITTAPEKTINMLQGETQKSEGCNHKIQVFQDELKGPNERERASS